MLSNHLILFVIWSANLYPINDHTRDEKEAKANDPNTLIFNELQFLNSFDVVTDVKNEGEGAQVKGNNIKTISCASSYVTSGIAHYIAKEEGHVIMDELMHKLNF